MSDPTLSVSAIVISFLFSKIEILKPLVLYFKLFLVQIWWKMDELKNLVSQALESKGILSKLRV
jgi:hypothetical protein